MRINGFTQIKLFYSWTFNNQELNIKPQHISLYLFLLNQNNRVNWVEWFRVPLDLGMIGSCIGNKKTYYNCLKDLCNWELIGYKKGVNEWKTPLIKLEVLKSTSIYTASVPTGVNQHTPQVSTQPHLVYKPLTSKPIKQITKVYSIEVHECFNNCLLSFDNHLHPQNENTWLDTIEKLNRIEKLPFDFIENLVKKVRQDDFWSVNFLSITKLRKKNKEGLMYVSVFHERFKDKPKPLVKNGKVNMTEFAKTFQ